MHATVTAAEIRCDHCLAQLPPRVGENAVLARIRAAQNGWTTVSYGPRQIPIAEGRGGRPKIHLPKIGEFCPACEPPSIEQMVRLSQERLLAGKPPFQERFPYLRSVGFQLIEYKPVVPAPTRPVGQLSVKDANRLVMHGKCTWTCLLAIEETCICRCGGPYHAAAVESLSDLRAIVAAPVSDLKTA